MSDAFRQLEGLEADSFVRGRLEKYGMRLESVALPVWRVRYMIVSIEQNFVLQRGLTFRQVAQYAYALELNSGGRSVVRNDEQS